MVSFIDWSGNTRGDVKCPQQVGLGHQEPSEEAEEAEEEEAASSYKASDIDRLTHRLLWVFWLSLATTVLFGCLLFLLASPKTPYRCWLTRPPNRFLASSQTNQYRLFPSLVGGFLDVCVSWRVLLSLSLSQASLSLLRIFRLFFLCSTVCIKVGTSGSWTEQIGCHRRRAAAAVVSDRLLCKQPTWNPKNKENEQVKKKSHKKNKRKKLH